jgi:dephospho-CoA kinase
MPEQTRQPGRRTGGGPLVVLVTGGIGSGKSTFCRLMVACSGGKHLDADQIVHRLLAEDLALQDAIVERFGGQLRLPGGGIDRAALAAIVFHDPDKLRWLELLLHPVVARVLARRVEALKREAGVAIVLVEIPLLVEAGVPAWCDLVVTLVASAAARGARLERKGLSRNEITRRMGCQASDEERRGAADTVVCNDAGLDELKVAACALWRDWQHEQGVSRR